eukprot:815713_1
MDINMDNFDSVKVTAISTVDPVKDFQTMWQQRDDPACIETAVSQMWKVVSDLVDQSFQDRFYPKAVRCIQALRLACLNEDEWRRFNDGMNGLRQKYEFEKTKFWDKLASTGVLPIDSDECIESNVTTEKAAEFFSKKEIKQPIIVPVLEDNEDDFLAGLE